MKGKHTSTGEEAMRTMLQGAKEKAPENLKYRIMHQIEAERAVAPRKVENAREAGNLFKELGSIFGTMYAVLAVMIATAYFLLGKDFLLSPQFIGAAVFVAFVFSMLWMISRLDEHVQEKRFRKGRDREEE